MLANVDWKAMLVPDAPLLEMFVRGTAMYLSLFILLRVVLKRQLGTMGMGDLLLITLLADASQNGMAGEYRSLPNGLVLVSTIIFWNLALDWLSFRWAFMRKLIQPGPLLLVQNGRMLRANMRKELITEAELLGKLREKGVSDIRHVRKAFMESEGHISVVPSAN